MTDRYTLELTLTATELGALLPHLNHHLTPEQHQELQLETRSTGLADQIRDSAASGLTTIELNAEVAELLKLFRADYERQCRANRETTA